MKTKLFLAFVALGCCAPSFCRAWDLLVMPTVMGASAIHWVDRESVLREFDSNTEGALAALEHVLEANGQEALAAAYEQYVAGPFIALPNWYKYKMDRQALVNEFGADSPRVTAFDLGIQTAGAYLQGLNN